MNLNFTWKLIIALSLACTAMSRADEIQQCTRPPVTQHVVGTLFRLATGSYTLLQKDGARWTLADSAVLRQVKLTPCDADLRPERGVAVEVDGVGSNEAFRVMQMRVAGGKPLYPQVGRCIHCGCHMQMDSAQEADAQCQACQCKKKASECFK